MAGQDRHGYDIARDVGELSEGRVTLSAGTLYGALSRLCDEGLVSPTRDETVDGRRRRYYRLTGAGKRAMSAEVERLRSTAAILDARLGPRSGKPKLA